LVVRGELEEVMVFYEYHPTGTSLTVSTNLVRLGQQHRVEPLSDPWEYTRAIDESGFCGGEVDEL